MKRALATAALILLPAAAGCGPVSPRIATPTPLLDDQEKSLLVVGSVDALGWPAELQQRLDDFTGGERLYHVLNAATDGGGVQQWLAAPGTMEYARTIQALRTKFLADEGHGRGWAPVPEVVLLQPSSFPGAADTVNPELAGVDPRDALELLATRLRNLGVEHVLIGSWINGPSFDTRTPQSGTRERLLALQHEFVRPGADLGPLLVGCHPSCFGGPGGSPTPADTQAIAAAWFAALADSSGGS